MSAPTPPPPGVTIGLEQIYTLLIQLNTRVEVLMGWQRDMDSRAQDHEVRLRALERARWPLPALAILISVGTLVVSVLRF